MPDGSDATKVTAVSSIRDVAAEAWDACAGRADPFLSHAFLAALEDSGAVTAKSGWMPRHLVATDAAGRVAGCVPCYLKGHSFGEYVFDWSWAEAYERAGGRYYPKLQAAVPFTPVTGNRLLLHPEAPAGTADSLAAALVHLAQRLRVSSLHVTFPTEPEWRLLQAHGLLPRIGHQFQWVNRGYASFEDFLAALNSRKRKAIRKERRSVADSGVRLRILTGREIAERDWDCFFDFYCDTHDRKWGHAYLNREFFSRLGQGLGARVLLIVADDGDGRPVAAALNLIGADALYGRYWGCNRAYRFLHFEVCYYQAIELAIARRLQRVEAGAQGAHKLQRGYLPARTFSAHWIAEPGFGAAVQRFLAAECRAVEAEIAALAADSPFRRDGDGDPV